MYNSNIPDEREVPSSRRLLQSTLAAAVIAGILLVTVVMPAEYGLDPTGIGNVLGLKRMGEIKVSLAEEAASEEATPVRVPASEQVAPSVEAAALAVGPETTPSGLSHEMQVTLAPDEGTEIKVTMTKGSEVDYSWRTNGGAANFDVHGDSEQHKINYHNYSKGSEQASQGILKAAFDGNHGWFWRNRTAEPITITLRTNGNYSHIQHFK